MVEEQGTELRKVAFGRYSHQTPSLCRQRQFRASASAMPLSGGAVIDSGAL
jgi:hypothetical protein